MTTLRDSNLQKLTTQLFDVLIIGGGINGAVSAAALAAKGVKVALIDKGDFACSTSSNSSNLAWGGIKYLESHEYFLVNKLCKSRNHLMQQYPSTVKEIRFLTSIQKGFRFPPFFIYMGSLLYWAIGRFNTKAPKYLSASAVKKQEKNINTDNVAGGLEYSDCYFHDNDARFVFNFIRSGMSYGCIAANYVQAEGSSREGEIWNTQAVDEITAQKIQIKSKIIINAAGPEADTLNKSNQLTTKHHHLFSKGVHLIVDKIVHSHKVLAFFATDGRLFFVIPMGPRTCIGTTDTQVNTPHTQVTPEDRNFILDNINKLLSLSTPLTSQDIIAERCGVRPLVVEGNTSKADWVKMSRKHAIDTDYDNSYVSIFGGKLTDCLNVGEEITSIVQTLGVAVPYPLKKWYGEPDESMKQEFMHRAKLLGLDDLTPTTSSEPLTQRFWRRYGRNAFSMLESIREDTSKADLLIENSEYLRVEIEHAAKREMITKLEDFLRRRSKISLVVEMEALLKAPGLKEACHILFKEQAEQKLNEFINSLPE